MKNPAKSAPALSPQARELREQLAQLAQKIASFMGSEEKRITDIRYPPAFKFLS